MKYNLNKIILVLIILFIVAGCKRRNNPPDTPSKPNGPTNGIVSISYPFNSVANDPDEDSVAIRFAWGDGDTSDWSQLVLSGDSMTISHSYSSPNTYYVKAKAKDKHGATSKWSEAQEIKISVPGSLKWRYQTGGSEFASPMVSNDGTIYVGSFDNCLYAINQDGTLKWRFPTNDLIQSSPAIGSDGTVYIGSDDNCLYAINPEGELKWHFQTGDDVSSSPSIGPDGTIYVGSDGLYAINPDGTMKWFFETIEWIESSPAVGLDGTIFVGVYEYLSAINPDGFIEMAVSG